MLFVYSSWVGFVFLRHIRSHSHHFTHHPTGTHYTSAAKGYVCGTDIPSCHKQVRDISAIQTTVGYGIRSDTDMLCTCKKLLPREVKAVFFLREMQVYCPRSSHRSIGIHFAVLYIHLS